MIGEGLFDVVNDPVAHFPLALLDRLQEAGETVRRQYHSLSPEGIAVDEGRGGFERLSRSEPNAGESIVPVALDPEGEKADLRELPDLLVRLNPGKEFFDRLVHVLFPRMELRWPAAQIYRKTA